MITNTFPPRRFGGITGVAAYTVATKLAQRGHHVTVYTTDAGNDKYARLNTEKETAIDGVRVRYFRNISNLFARAIAKFADLKARPEKFRALVSVADAKSLAKAAFDEVFFA